MNSHNGQMHTRNNTFETQFFCSRKLDLNELQTAQQYFKPKHQLENELITAVGRHRVIAIESSKVVEWFPMKSSEFLRLKTEFLNWTESDSNVQNLKTINALIVPTTFLKNISSNSNFVKILNFYSLFFFSLGPMLFTNIELRYLSIQSEVVNVWNNEPLIDIIGKIMISVVFYENLSVIYTVKINCELHKIFWESFVHNPYIVPTAIFQRFG